MLESITIRLPQKDQDFENKFLNFLGQFGIRKGKKITFQRSSDKYLPRTAFEFSDCQTAEAIFCSSTEHKVKIANTTSQEKKSPLAYTPIKLGEFLERINDLNFKFVDHIGFDIFWPEDAHPAIRKAREVLSKECLYFLYPTGEDWDFIIPATPEEIASKVLDYKKIRRPKFEIVSLDYTSTPIIQFDISVKENFDQIKSLFPEGYPDNSLKNVWVYIENPYGLYIAIVIGRRGNADWYSFLKKGLVK